MPQDPYTHEIKFDLEDGFIRGEAEFNSDEETSFKITEWSQPLKQQVLDYFSELMTLVEKITHENSAIKKIIIKKKE